ncbi:MAG: DUF4157 domain-containing protein [Nitrosomonadaceae bacterium]|nr:DUF4157 domain-containing protein [Nitrosomonadaceae bacterium]
MTNSPQAIAQRKISQQMHSSSRMLVQRKLLSGESVQRVEEDESLQKKSESIQRVGEEELQKKATMDSSAQLKEQSSGKPNNTGLPDNLKSGIENLSGLSMDSVRVHYNSSQPAQLNALAYAQGTDIHVAPGQEQHLSHEAWHVVQQAQGRVQPTMQMKDGVPINDDKGLEHEADVMGAKALGTGFVQLVVQKNNQHSGSSQSYREVEISELSDEDARKHISDSFKKGKTDKPLINQSGSLVQRLPKKESYSGGDLFTVLKSDLNTGTGTSEGTRNYVNDPKTYKPDSILFDYQSAKTPKAGLQVVKGNKNAFEVENPEADYSYKSGKLWDAGHKLGRQNGGLGNNNDWVFPQNPAFNQGNSKNMDDVEETNPLWRAHEDTFYSGVKSDGAGAWWIKLV